MAFNDGAFQPIPYAEFQPITDPGNLYTADNIGGQLQEVKTQANTTDAFAMRRNARYYNRPAAFRIQCAAGRFNFSWSNTSGRMWVFPAGTVQYSDGTTPIRTSTDEKPDVIIPAGGGVIWLVSAMWNGAYSLTDNDTDARFTGSLADLPPLTYYLALYNCTLVTGSLADLPPLTHTLNLNNCTSVTGSLADLPPLTYYLALSNCTSVTGSLADLPPLTYYLHLADCKLVTGSLADLPPLTYLLSLSGCKLVTGSLADLPPLTYYLDLAICKLVTGSLADLPPLTYYLRLLACTLVTGAYTSVNGSNVPTTTDLTGTGLSATDMDNTLIAYAACTKTGGAFTATGKTRTTASDAAVLHLTTPTGSGGLGWTVTGLTVV